MRLLLTRLPLFIGIVLLQVPPVTAPTVPSSLTDLLLQGLSNVPVYVILAYILIKQQGNTAKENERRDAHESAMTDLLTTQIKRLDNIEEDRKEAEKERNETARLQAQSSKDLGEMVKALGSRTEFLIDEDKKRDDILKTVQTKATTLYDRFSKVFPRDTSIDELFADLKKVLEDTKRACEEAKTKPAEPTKIEAEITLTPAPTEKPADATGGSEAA